MSKVEDYIRKNTIQFSNEDGFDYVPWLTPDQARKAVEIAREEVIEEAAEWMKLYVINHDAIDVFEMEKEFKNYMEEKV